MNAHVLGISVDSAPCLTAWGESLGGITYPLLSDFWPHGAVAEGYGVLRSEGYSERTVLVVDAEGIVRYIDVHAIDDQPDNDILFAELAKLEPERAAALEAQELLQAASTGDTAVSPAPGELVMYCTSWCPDCARAREFLAHHEITYTEIDVSRDRSAKTRAAGFNAGELHTPTFELDGEVCVDFDASRLSALLGLDL